MAKKNAYLGGDVALPDDVFSDLDSAFTTKAPAAPVAPERGDFSRGFGRAWAQLPELGYGTAAMAANSAEALFGEGGISSAAKNYFTGKFLERQEANKEYAPSVEWTDAWDRLNQGELGPVMDWLQDTAGYVVGQGIQTVGTGLIGGLVGKTALKAGTEKLLGGMVARQADKIAAEAVAAKGLQGAAAEAAKAQLMPEAARIAAGRIASGIGAGVALNAQNLGMEAGDIYGGLLEESKKTGREITSDDLARAWGWAAAAAGTETATDLLGLGALTGRVKIPGGKGRAARGLMAAGIGAPVEGGTEYAQTWMEQRGAGQDTDTPEARKERINAAAMGVLGGTLMGGGAGVLAPVNVERQTQDTNDAATRIMGSETIDQAIAQAEASVDGRADRIQAERERLMAMREGMVLRAAKNDDLAREADAADLAQLVGSEESDLAYRRRALLEAQQKQRDLDALQAESRDVLGRNPEQQVAAAAAATDEEPTAMELAFRNARGMRRPTPAAPVERPATPIVTPEQPAPQALPPADDLGNQLVGALANRNVSGHEQPPGAIGTDAGNGFKHGPNEDRYRVSENVTAVGGGVMLEKRSKMGTPSAFYVGVDGVLVDADSVNFLDGNSLARLWIPKTSTARNAAVSIIDKMGQLPVGNAEREKLKLELKRIVAEDSAPGASTEPAARAQTPASATPRPATAQPEPGAAGLVQKAKPEAAPGQSAPQPSKEPRRGQRQETPEVLNQAGAGEQPVPADEPAYSKGKAVVFARRMTAQGLPSEAYPHPTKPGMWAIRPAGAAQPGEQAEPPAVEVPASRPARRKSSSTLLQAIINRGGINRSIMSDVGGDRGGRYAPGVFTNNGHTDLSLLAEYLVNEDGFNQIDLNREDDQRGAQQLADLIARAIHGERILSSEAMAAEAGQGEERQYRMQVRQEAERLGIKYVGRPFSRVEEEVHAARERRNAEEVAALAEQERQAYDEVIDVLRILTDSENASNVTEAIFEKLNREGVGDAQFYRLARAEVEKLIDDLGLRSAEDLDAEIAAARELERLDNETRPVEDLPQPDAESAEPRQETGGGNDRPGTEPETARPTFDLEGQTEEQARAELDAREAEAERQRAEEAKAAEAERKAREAKEIEDRAKRGVGADFFTLDAQVNNQAEQRKADAKRADAQLAGQGDIFSAPASPPTEEIPEAVRKRVSGALDSLREVAQAIADAKSLEDRVGQAGRYQADTLENRKGNIESAQEVLRKFRELAAGKGIDAQAFIDGIGGEPDLKPSKEAQAWIDRPGVGAEATTPPAAATRSSPKTTVQFKTPISGPSGTKLISYTWQWKPFEFVDARGEDRVGRMSDWDKAETNAETGRDIVHQFVVQTQDGETKTVSVETALRLMGFTNDAQRAGFKSVESASRTLARNRMLLSEAEDAKKAFEKDRKEIEGLPMPAATRDETDGDRWRMGDAWIMQSQRLFPAGKDGELLPERRRVLEESWRLNRMRDRGWKSEVEGRILSDKIDGLKRRIEKAQNRIDELVAEEAQKAAPAPQESADPIGWDAMDREARAKIVVAARWITNAGTINPTGRRIIGTAWSDLTNLTRQTLMKHAPQEAIATPAAHEQPTWHTKLPAEGLPITESQKRATGYQQVAPRLAEDAHDAMAQHQRMIGGQWYLYVLPAANGRNGVARFLPEDQTPPKPWKLVNGEGLRVSMMTRAQVVEKAREWLSREPIIGDEKATPPATTKDSLTVESVQPPTIQDFGEKIGGARKDVWTSFKDDLSAVSDDEIVNQPFSKVWPQPDYQALLDGGADPWAVGFMHAARDEIPPKPRKGYKVTSWAKNVEMLRGLTQKLLSGEFSIDTAKSVFHNMSVTGSSSFKKLASRIELYELVGHAKSLEGMSFAHHHYSFYRGRDNVSLWVVEKDAKATAWSNWPTEIATGDTKEEALAAFKARYAELNTEKARSKEVSFDIYAQGREVFVGKKVGRNIMKLAGPFQTVKEAREYRTNHQEELSALLEKRKEIPRERRDTNEPRVGEDMRNAQDVTPAMFADTFGFRGVEFGNWVEQGRRQKDLNDAFDALMDMAAIIGVPPKALSLNGELGLAFGARGSGGKNAAAAHYEHGKVVINLTKMSGAGALGHEWWHALDSYFARLRGTGDGMMSGALDVSLASRESPFEHHGAVRKEMIEAFGAVMRAIRNTALKARSAKLDEKRTKEYWTTKPEMSARAFESYLISKLQDQGASNDYLANVVSEESWKAAEKLGFELDDTYPYPTAGEIPTIRAGFDQFFQTLQTKETDKGVAMFSRSGSSDAFTLEPLGGALINHEAQIVIGGEIPTASVPNVRAARLYNAEGEHEGNAAVIYRDGKIPMLVDIRMFAPQTGTGEKYVRAMVAAAGENGLYLYDVQKQAEGFWTKMGAIPENLGGELAHGNGFLFWSDYAGQRSAQVDAARPAQDQAPGRGDAQDGADFLGEGKARFERADKQGRIHAEDLNAVAAEFRAIFPGLPIHPVENEKALPASLRQAIKDMGASGDVAAAFHEGAVWMVQSGIHSLEHARKILPHEGTHAGLEWLLGGAKDRLLLDILQRNADVSKKAKEIASRYGYSQVRAAEEVLADMGPKVKTLKGWAALITWVRRQFRKLGWVQEWTNRDVEDLVLRALAQAKRGPKVSREVSRASAYQRTNIDSPLWYSALAKAIQSNKMDAMPAAQWKAWLLSNAGKMGVKKDEIQWSGITDWLDAQQGKLSKDDVSAFLEQGGVKVEETMLGGKTKQQLINEDGYLDFFDDKEYAGGGTKFSEYQLPGGENYRELLLTLPGKKEEWHVRQNEKGWEVYSGRVSLGEFPSEAIAVDEAAYRNRTAHEQVSFRSAHFDQPNILAHVRFNERTDVAGNKVLFIEEVQSDWGQQGKREGFGDVVSDPQDWLTDRGYDITRLNRTQIENEATALGWKGWSKPGLPSAPFVTDTKSWTALALKRMIRYAAENGFDAIAWTTGEQQAERYKLSKRVDSIQYIERDGKFNVQVSPKNGGGWTNAGMPRWMDANKLDDYFGKGVADKMRAGEGRKDRSGSTFLHGLDLDVGGEGMKGYYDQIVPQVAGDLLRKFGGGKVEEFAMMGQNAIEQRAFPNRRYAPDMLQPGFLITDALRETAMGGLPMFSRTAPPVEGAMLARGQTPYTAPTIEVDGVTRPTTNDKGQPLAQTEEGLRNFWRWFSPRPSQLLDGLSVSEVSSLKRNAKALADFIESQSGLPEPDRFKVIPTSVFAHVSGVVDNAKILDAVIGSLTVDVVNFLSSKQLSAKDVLHDAAMLKNVFSINPASDVALGVNPSSIAELTVRVVANAGAKISGLASRSLEANSAVLADANNPVLGAHIRKSPKGDLSIIAGFGDSKVVDDQGRPLVVYHGTSATTLEAFDDSMSGSSMGSASGLDGFYFTADPKTAEMYAKTSEKAQHHLFGRFYNRQNIIPVFLSMKNTLVYTKQRGDQITLMDTLKRRVISEAKEGGHDGVIFKGFRDTPTGRGATVADVFVAFESTQIKSATGNRGTFDPANPNILLSRTSQALDLATDVLDTIAQPSAKSFGALKGLQTQLHKARSVPAYARVFRLAMAFRNDLSRAAFRPWENAKDILPAYDDIKGAWNALLHGKKQSADITAAGKFLFEGTMYGGGKPLSGLLFSDAKLKSMGATDEQIRLYHQARDAIDASLDEMSAAVAWKLAKRYLHPAAKYSAINDPATAKDTFLQLLEVARDAAENQIGYADPKAAQAAEKEIAATMKAVEGVFDHAEALKAAGYAPLMRFGRYTVDVFETDGNGKVKGDRLEFRTYETEIEAKAGEKELRKVYANQPGVVIQRGVKGEETGMFAGVDPETVALFAKQVADIPGIDIDKAVLDEYYRQSVSERSALTRTIKRKGIAGYSEDLPRVLASFLTSNARYVSSTWHMGDMREEIQSIRDAKIHGDVADEAQKLYDYINGTQEPGAAIRGAMFAWYLGGSPAAAAINLTQPLLMTWPYLSQFGTAKAAKMLAASVASAINPKLVPAGIRAALRRAQEEGIVEAQEIHHLYQEGMRPILSRLPGGESMRARAQGAAALWGSLFGMAENFNRRITFIAAYKMAAQDQALIRKFGSAYEFARRAVEETQGIYAKENRPEWARGTGPLGAVGVAAFTFKQYSIQYVELLSRMWKSGPEGKKAAGLMLGILILASGLQGIPFADDLEDLIDTLLQSFGYRGNSKKAMRDTLRSAAGEHVADLVMYGFSADTPIDVQARLGLGNMIPATALFKPSEQGKASQLAELVGPPGGMAKQVGDFVDAVQSGKQGDAFKAFSPKMVQDTMKAWQMWDTGDYRDSRGRKVTEVSGADAAIKLSGFQPQSVAEKTRRDRMIQQDISRVRGLESDIASLWTEGILDKEPEKVSRAREMLADWNSRNPDTPIRVTSQQILSRVKQSRMDREQRMTKAAPKEMRGYVADGTR